MSLIESLGITGLVIVYALFWLIPFFLVLRHLVKIERPLLMKVIWVFIFLSAGLFGIAIYIFVVYLPEKRKEKQAETKEEIK